MDLGVVKQYIFTQVSTLEILQVLIHQIKQLQRIFQTSNIFSFYSKLIKTVTHSQTETYEWPIHPSIIR